MLSGAAVGSACEHAVRCAMDGRAEVELLEVKFAAAARAASGPLARLRGDHHERDRVGRHLMAAVLQAVLAAHPAVQAISLRGPGASVRCVHLRDGRTVRTRAQAGQLTVDERDADVLSLLSSLAQAGLDRFSSLLGGHAAQFHHTVTASGIVHDGFAELHLHTQCEPAGPISQ